MSHSLWCHGLQHARLPCPLPSPIICSNSCPLSQWCHPTISSSVIHFPSCLQSFPASGSFPMSQVFTWGGQSTGVSALASFLPKNTQSWSPSEWTGWISLQSKGLSRVFSCVVGRGCLLWPVHFLGKILLVFALLHSVFQGQTCLLFQVFLDFLLLHSSPL